MLSKFLETMMLKGASLRCMLMSYMGGFSDGISFAFQHFKQLFLLRVSEVEMKPRSDTI